MLITNTRTFFWIAWTYVLAVNPHFGPPYAPDLRAVVAVAGPERAERACLVGLGLSQWLASSALVGAGGWWQ